MIEVALWIVASLVAILVLGSLVLGVFGVVLAAVISILYLVVIWPLERLKALLRRRA